MSKRTLWLSVLDIKGKLHGWVEPDRATATSTMEALKQNGHVFKLSLRGGRLFIEKKEDFKDGNINR